MDVMASVAVAMGGMMGPVEPMSVHPERPAVVCEEISGASLGSLPLSVQMRGTEVHFSEWIYPDEAHPDIVGFALQKLPAEVTVTVGVGEREYEAREARFLSPTGLLGPKAKAIEWVRVCTRV